MAHDFSIRKADDATEFCYFFGYAGGVMYRHFNAAEFNGGVSGTNQGKVIDAIDAMFAIQLIISELKDRGYDHDAANFERFNKNVVLKSGNNQKYRIHFS